VGSAVIRNCAVTNNTVVPGRGGGIYLEGDGGRVEGCVIRGNVAESGGGGIYCYSPTGGTVEIIGSVISSNILTEYYDGKGAGLYCNGIDISMTDSQIIRNHGFYGGGIYSRGGRNVEISDSVINDNTAEEGGGIYCSNGCNLKMTGSTIKNNSANTGGGIFAEYSALEIVGTEVNENIAGGPYGIGGGIYIDNCSLIVLDSNISNNTSYSGGGIIFCSESDLTVTGCLIENNQGSGVSVSSRVGYGDIIIRESIIRGNKSDYLSGGVLCYSVNGLGISNCVISDNIGREVGGVYCYVQDELNMVNSTIVGNKGMGLGAYAGGLFISGKFFITNCIIRDNRDENDDLEMFAYSSSSILNYSNIKGGWEGEGNIDVEPLFVDAEGGDYHLQSEAGRWESGAQEWVIDDVTSPCIDAGDPASDYCGELWPNGGRINMGAYGGTGEASMSLSDVGSAADMNCDDGVDLEDFGELSGEWQKQEVLLKEDIDRDGTVGLSDLVMFCEEWLL
jgi:hypothetical protein